MNKMNDAETHQQLGRIEGKLDAFAASMQRAHERIDKHDDRLGQLEQFRSRIVAYAAAVATGASVVANAALKKMGLI